MKRTISIFAAAGMAAAGAVVGAAAASAETAVDPVATAELGEQARLDNGGVVQGWTISGLRHSTDVIPYQVQGDLWEATATDEAIQGSVIPIVSNLNARAADGQTYRALFQVATPQGVNPATLGQGQTTTGKIYFDVTGRAPDSVVYNDGERDLLLWVAPPPEPVGPATAPARSQPTPSGNATSSAPQAAEAATTPEDEAPEAADAAPVPVSIDGAPAVEGVTPVPAGSQGTPLPAGSAGTPLPAGVQGTPAPEAVEGAPAPEAVEGTVPAPAGSQGTPIPIANQGTPVTDVPVAPAAVGSQGTPLPDAPHGVPAPVPPAEQVPVGAAEAAPAAPAGEEIVAPTTTPVPAP